MPPADDPWIDPDTGRDASEAPLAFGGGPILTMDARFPSAGVVIVDGDRIAAVGPSRLVDRFPHATRVDLGGHTLLPGLIDAHTHLSVAALHPTWADLGPAAEPETVASLLIEQADGEPQAGWVRGRDWEARHPVHLTRHHLDALGLDRPVMVAHYSLHACVVSTHGLDLLEIGHGTPEPPGGVIERDPDGSPNGVLRERAWADAHARSMAAYTDPDRWSGLVEQRARALLSEGITAIHDAACSPEAELVYRRLASEGRLPVSVLAMPHASRLLAGPDPARLEGPSTGEGDEWLRVGAVKLFADGGAHPWIRAGLRGRRREIGIPFPPVLDQARLAAERGFDVAIHAMGNAGLAAALEAFEALARRQPAPKLRVEHATLASPDQVRSLARIGVAAVVQPGFVDTLGRNVHSLEFDDATWMPFADLVEQGVPVAASSDHPSGTCAPLATSLFGITRTTADGHPVGPGQSLPMDEWLRAWTVGAAAAGGQSGERGSLTPGKRADLVVVDGPLDGSQVPRVIETWVAGRRRHPD